MALKIVIEGPFKSGKSTLAAMLERFLAREHVRVVNKDGASQEERDRILEMLDNEEHQKFYDALLNGGGGISIETRLVQTPE